MSVNSVLERRRQSQMDVDSASTLQGQLEILRLDEEAWKTRDFKRCVSLCTLLTDANAEQPKANFFVRRARANLELHRLDDVLSDTERAIRIQPNNAKAFALQGYATILLIDSTRLPNLPLRSMEATSKWQARMNSALGSLIRAKELDPSLESNDIFRKYWSMCERERALMGEGTTTIRAAPFLASLHKKAGVNVPPGALDDKVSRRPNDEHAMAIRMNLTGNHVPNFEDCVYLKSEMLFFLVSLSRRCFKNDNRQLLDTVKKVRTVGEYREAAQRAEQKIGYESQKASWQLDRQAWLAGVRLASCPGELIVALCSLKSSMLSWAFETRPDRLAQQVRAVVNDLDAFGDEILESAHPGECKKICLTLLTKGIAIIPVDYTCGLSVVKGRMLPHDLDHVDEIVHICNGVVERSNRGHCSRTDLEAALGLRENAARKAGPVKYADLRATFVEPVYQSSQELLLTSIGTIGGSNGDSNNKSSRFIQNVEPSSSADCRDSSASLHLTGDDASRGSNGGELDATVELAWKSLSPKQREDALTVTLEQLEKSLPSAVFRRLGPMLQSISTAEDLLEPYRRVSSPLIPAAQGDSVAASNIEPIPGTESLVVKGCTRELKEIAPDEARYWNEFEGVMEQLIASTQRLERLVKEEIQEISESSVPFKLTPPPGTLAQAESLRAAVVVPSLVRLEHQILTEREGKILDFGHKCLTSGWKTRGDQSAFNAGKPIARSSSLNEGDFRDPELLFEDVYCIRVPVTSKTSGQIGPENSPDDLHPVPGIFVSELCARVCHSQSTCTFVGRAPLRSECDSSCKLTNDPRLCYCPKVDRANGNISSKHATQASAAVVVRDDSSICTNFLLGRSRLITKAIGEQLLSGDDEDALAKHLAMAIEEAKASERLLSKLERLKWGFEQLKALLQWTHHAQKAFASSSFDEKQIRGIEDFASHSVKFQRLLNQFYEENQSLVLSSWKKNVDNLDEKIEDAFGKVPSPLSVSIIEDPDVDVALAKCANCLQERQHLRLNIGEARANLMLEEERLQAQQTAGTHSGFVPCDAVQIAQQQVMRGEEYVKLTASVYSHSQHVAFLETRLMEIDALVANSSIHLLKSSKSTILAKADWVLAHLTPQEFKSLVDYDICLCESDRQRIVALRENLYRSTVEPSDSSRMFAAHPSLVRAAAEVLFSFPRSVTNDRLEFNRIDQAWQELDAASHRARQYIAKVFAEEVSSAGNRFTRQSAESSSKISSLVSAASDAVQHPSFGIAHTATQELNQIVIHSRHEHTEAHARQVWRRAEFFRYIHLRNQTFYHALSNVIVEQVLEIESRGTRDAIMKQLMEEEDRTKQRKVAEKTKKASSSKSQPQQQKKPTKSETISSIVNESSESMRETLAKNHHSSVNGDRLVVDSSNQGTREVPTVAVNDQSAKVAGKSMPASLSSKHEPVKVTTVATEQAEATLIKSDADVGDGLLINSQQLKGEKESNASYELSVSSHEFTNAGRTTDEDDDDSNKWIVVGAPRRNRGEGSASARQHQQAQFQSKSENVQGHGLREQKKNGKVSSRHKLPLPTSSSSVAPQLLNSAKSGETSSAFARSNVRSLNGSHSSRSDSAQVTGAKGETIAPSPSTSPSGLPAAEVPMSRSVTPDALGENQEKVPEVMMDNKASEAEMASHQDPHEFPVPSIGSEVKASEDEVATHQNPRNLPIPSIGSEDKEQEVSTSAIRFGRFESSSISTMGEDVGIEESYKDVVQTDSTVSKIEATLAQSSADGEFPVESTAGESVEESTHEEPMEVTEMFGGEVYPLHGSHFPPPAHGGSLNMLPPPAWICPLTRQVMVDPVIAPDGHVYERFAIARWLSSSRFSPVSNLPMETDVLVPNHALRVVIQEGMSHIMRMQMAPPPPPLPLPTPYVPLNVMPPPQGQPQTTMMHSTANGLHFPTLVPVAPVQNPLLPPGPFRPVCMYFQQGTCRYGPGCRNLHVLLADPVQVRPSVDQSFTHPQVIPPRPLPGAASEIAESPPQFVSSFGTLSENDAQNFDSGQTSSLEAVSMVTENLT